MNTEFDRSIDRLLRSEGHRSGATGFGTTKQGQALVRNHLEQLTNKITADRKRGGDKIVWGALKGIGDSAIALRLMVAGISVSEGRDLGVDRDGQKNFRDQALWIGSNFGHRRELAFRVGAWGINLLQSLPVFGLDTGDVLRMTASADEIMDDVVRRSVANNPLLWPLTIPPEDWTQVRKGGLPADHWARVPLIRERHSSIEAAARNAIGTGRMQRVLDAINALQRVPFSINEPVLDFILRSGEPPSPGLPPPAWQRKKFEKWAQSSAKLNAFHADTLLAEMLVSAERFWVPLNICFRGRVYGFPHFNFQREDLVRSLFLFANGERIGEDGLLWLKAHVAGTANGNTWSPEEKPGRLAFDDRVAWTDTHLGQLRAIGDAVLRGDDPAKLAWALPGDRYQFIAACVELAQALKAGPDFKTRLPLTFDGSCSGLQHLCAMTRAEEGRYVNLTAADEQNDFYGQVAFRAFKNAPDLMQDQFDREIVKQPAMSYFYGARAGGFSKAKNGDWRPYGMTKQIIDVLKERGHSTKGAKQLARAIYKVIEGTVPKATAVRDFLEKLACLCTAKNKPLRWTTLLGLPVINCYYEPEIKRISVPLKGRRRRVNLTVGDKKTIADDRAANSATANFVHSVDATHMQLVALAAAEEGIDMVSVHDCFGCIAPRAAHFNEIIREQFFNLHKSNNLLGGVWASVRRDLPQSTKLPAPPQTGNLEIEKVLESFHAFK